MKRSIQCENTLCVHFKKYKYTFVVVPLRNSVWACVLYLLYMYDYIEEKIICHALTWRHSYEEAIGEFRVKLWSRFLPLTQPLYPSGSNSLNGSNKIIAYLLDVHYYDLRYFFYLLLIITILFYWYQDFNFIKTFVDIFIIILNKILKHWLIFVQNEFYVINKVIYFF